jgi:hypothetical protein
MLHLLVILWNETEPGTFFESCAYAKTNTCCKYGTTASQMLIIWICVIRMYCRLNSITHQSWSGNQKISVKWSYKSANLGWHIPEKLASWHSHLSEYQISQVIENVTYMTWKCQRRNETVQNDTKCNQTAFVRKQFKKLILIKAVTHTGPTTWRSGSTFISRQFSKHTLHSKLTETAYSREWAAVAKREWPLIYKYFCLRMERN